MRQIQHPMSRAIYELDEDFNVLITARDGKTGTFDPEGRYLHGDVRGCDPELARWVGLGPRERGDISQNRRFMNATEVLQKHAEELAASKIISEGAAL
jgi:hypothetical protein